MKAFTQPNKVPPGGYWIYRDPDTGATLKAPSLMRLRNQVATHRASNAQAPINLETFHQAVCENHPDQCYDSEAPPMLTQIKTALQAAGDWATSGFKMAGKEKLEARLAVCYQCSYWGGVQGGSLIQGKCGKCGCNGIKLALDTSRCPEGKW